MKRFLIVIEKANGTNGNYSAYSPDLSGCVATGSSREEVERNMREAIELHLRGLAEDGQTMPEAESFAGYIEVEEHVG